MINNFCSLVTEFPFMGKILRLQSMRLVWDQVWISVFMPGISQVIASHWRSKYYLNWLIIVIFY